MPETNIRAGRIRARAKFAVEKIFLRKILRIRFSRATAEERGGLPLISAIAHEFEHVRE